MTPTLSALHIFPVKSCAALSPAEVQVEPRGLAGDRRWMIVDPAGKFVTGRLYARMPLIRATPLAHGLRLEAPDAPALEIAFPAADAPRLAVEVWKSRVDAVCAGAAADAWISRVLGTGLRLVHMDQAAQRAVSADYGRPGDEVSFADGFPHLLISQAALDQLNTRLSTPVSMLNFRPNLVVSGTAPHAEDDWKRIRIGEVEFDLVKPCTRCVFTTVDPLRGERRDDGEPLKTLTSYRRTPAGVTFGQNLIARGQGVIRVGDRVEVLA
ncbi:MOSC domain-containing protein [Tahibacter harae]|uniref:MOSC domain-containing protein n=1 Tax=Tahibacter harae TaxID=2963937 RepID=A0ABT1QQL2_9GAMM|nr:MOSC domain-containing protein [Tahibacter harae]MCQ4164580.1 MOSC domain-containing protein [Tahibacter harae]